MLFAHRPEQTVIGPRRRPSGHGQRVKVAQHPEGLSFTVAPGGRWMAARILQRRAVGVGRCGRAGRSRNCLGDRVRLVHSAVIATRTCGIVTGDKGAPLKAVFFCFA
jgi:hypothetical protein